MKHPKRVEDYLGHIGEAIERAISYLEPLHDFDAFAAQRTPLVEAASWTTPRPCLRRGQDRPSTSSNGASPSRRRLPKGDKRECSAAAAVRIRPVGPFPCSADLIP